MYIVADSSSHNGMQIVNLTETIYNAKVSGSDDIYQVVGTSGYSTYTKFKKCHNIFINEDTGYLYAVGTKTCNGGLHVVDISDPSNPQQVACWAHSGDTSYVHDVHCVVYHGPDTRYQGRGKWFC